MQYTLLFYENAEDFASRNDPEREREYWAAWPLYMKAIRESGALVSGAGLEAPEMATTVRLRTDGEPLVQDGPVAETKEHLGGFFIIEAADLDEALAWAARCPTPPGRLVEVRPNLIPRA